MEESQPTSREAVRVLSALSDENRFRIVELLAAEEQELSCGAIGKALDMSPSLLSHHLAILADAEIVGRRKNGLWTMNVLQRPVIERQVQTLQSLIGSGNGRSSAVIHLHRDGEESETAPASDPTPPVSDGTRRGGGAIAGS